MPILQFRNDMRRTAEYHPSYSATRQATLAGLKDMFSMLLESKTLGSSDRAYYETELRKVRASISELQRNHAA